MKVLLVDDSGTMRAVQKRCLLQMGISEDEIHEAEDGAAGLKMFEADAFDVILTDWNMPIMNGLEFVVEVRKLNKAIPIVMVTTESEKHRVIEAIQAGVSDYMVKPFDKDGFRQKLQKWIAVEA